jgi:hypothetical protein
MLLALIETVSELLELENPSDATLAYAVRAAELAVDVSRPGGNLLFVTQFYLGRAQLDAGRNLEAARTFEDLIRFRAEHRRSPDGVDGRAEELRGWLSKARGK